MTYGEAKQATRGAYLHWHRGANGRRCWGIRGKARTRAAGQFLARFVPPERTVDETQQPENELPLFVSLMDHPSWAWAERARRASWFEVEPIGPVIPLPDAADARAEYSTFAPGQEPDVWPEMETAASWVGAAVATVAAFVLAGLVVGWLFWPFSSLPSRAGGGNS